MANMMLKSPVDRWKTKVNKNSAEYKKNYDEMNQLIGKFTTQIFPTSTGKLNENLAASRDQGRKEHIERHIKNGKLLARDRIDLLLDEDSPFLELMPLAGLGQADTPVGGGIVAGIGIVSGVECIVSASVPTIKGGNFFPIACTDTRIDQPSSSREISPTRRNCVRKSITQRCSDPDRWCRSYSPGRSVPQGRGLISRFGDTKQEGNTEYLRCIRFKYCR
jgi:hypothetical protein